jgi:hypothetical protein
VIRTLQAVGLNALTTSQRSKSMRADTGQGGRRTRGVPKQNQLLATHRALEQLVCKLVAPRRSVPTVFEKHSALCLEISEPDAIG